MRFSVYSIKVDKVDKVDEVDEVDKVDPMAKLTASRRTSALRIRPQRPLSPQCPLVHNVLGGFRTITESATRLIAQAKRCGRSD